MKVETVRVRIEEDLKDQASEVLKELGLDMSKAIRLFLTKVVEDSGLPFDLTLQQKD